VLLVAAMAFSYIYLSKTSNNPTATSTTASKPTLTKLTNTGRVEKTLISSDGKYVAYLKREDEERVNKEDKDRYSVWLLQLPSTNPLQLIPPLRRVFWSMQFSPDNNFLYFVTMDTNYNTDIVRVSILGGELKTIASDVTNHPFALSPDGRRLVYTRSDEGKRESSLLIANSDGTDEQVIAKKGGVGGFGSSAWSPDGKQLAYFMSNYKDSALMLRSTDGASQRQVLSMENLDTFEPIIFLPDGKFIYTSAIIIRVEDGDVSGQPNSWQPVPAFFADGSGYVFIDRDESGLKYIHEVSLKTGKIEEIPPRSRYADNDVSITADSTALVFTDNSSNVVLVTNFRAKS
jgi:Tol biopolymer transport system component